MTILFEIIRAALLFLSIGLLVRQILFYEGVRDWTWWFINLVLIGYIAAFIWPVLQHTNALLHINSSPMMAPLSAVLAVAFGYAALICLQVHIAGGRKQLRSVLLFNLAVIGGLSTIELVL